MWPQPMLLTKPAPGPKPLPEILVQQREAMQSSHGIKLRDFAYENPLPVRTCRCCAKPPPECRQSQSNPTARRLKRKRDMRDEARSPMNALAYVPPEFIKRTMPPVDFGEESSQEEPLAKRPRTLGREITGPIKEHGSRPSSQRPALGHARHQGALAERRRGQNLGPLRNTSGIFGGPVAGSSMPTTRIRQDSGRTMKRNGSSQVDQDMDVDEFDSFMDEDYIPTPIITPQASRFFGGLSRTSSSESLASTEPVGRTPEPSFAPAKLPRERSLSDLSQIISRHNTPLVLNSRATILRPISATSSDHNLDSHADAGPMPSTSANLRESSNPPGLLHLSAGMPRSLATRASTPIAGPSAPQTPYRLRPRSNQSPMAAPLAPRKTVAPRYAHHRDPSPTLALTLARQARKAGKAPAKAAGKTRSTLSRKASDKSVSQIKPAVRRSPRTKTAARSVLSCVLIESRTKTRKQ
ncbi:hypothetical protein BDW22DRAFT_467773 [Trametopsis cervina]|nr:hypothetical protein BDW22DRAFT_467773 [Trametopsis cervina]